ncbi:MAG: VanZ family protein [Gemmataceae bacterium]
MKPLPQASVDAAPAARYFCWAALGAVLLAIYGSLLPFRWTPLSSEEAAQATQRLFRWYDASDLEARGDWLVSSTQYAILSFLLAGALCAEGGCPSILAAVLVVPACAALAVGIEYTQIYFPPRTVSLNDIVFEVSGAVAGVVVWLLVGSRVAKWVEVFANVGSLKGLADRLLPFYLVGLLIVQLMPFDFVVRRDELATKYAEGKILLRPFGAFDPTRFDSVLKVALNVFAFAPLGLLTGLETRRTHGMWWRPPLALLAIPALVEALQLVVYSRYFDITDVITGAVGVWIGWRIGYALRRHLKDGGNASNPPSRAATVVALIVWSITVTYFYWRPFDFTMDPARFRTDSTELPTIGWRNMTLLPFVDYYWGSKYHALDNFFRKALAFLPLGVILAWRDPDIYRRGAGLRVLLVATAAALTIEVGRYFLPTRVPSVTDLMIGVAGAWLGFRLTQQVRTAIWAETALLGWFHRPRIASQAYFRHIL